MEEDWHVIKKIIEKQLLIGNCILRKSTERNFNQSSCYVKKHDVTLFIER